MAGRIQNLEGCVNAKPKFANCQHCGEFCKVRSRGLCAGCYHKHDVRAKYKRDPLRCEKEETMEDLEALIAEQMKCLPKWWNHATEIKDRE
jgi:hypothetical protein